jgi:SAM-dependent methyltransferase
MATMRDAATDWSSVATSWDAEVDEVDRHSIAPTEALLHRVSPKPGERVLELAAGPGSLGVEWSTRVGPTGTVVLSDVAPGMVEVARHRTASLANVSVVTLDAARIDRPAQSFDVVACRMGLMFVPDPSVALAEIRRVLDTGGRVGVMTWASLEANPWMTVVGMAAMATGLVSGGPPIGPGGIFSLSDPEHLATLLGAAGFVDVEVQGFDIAFHAEDVEAHVRRVGSLAGPLAAVLGTATEEQWASVVTTASQLAEGYVTSDGVDLPGRALVATGRV